MKTTHTLGLVNQPIPKTSSKRKQKARSSAAIKRKPAKIQKRKQTKKTKKQTVSVAK
jgi:hypothetical protein